MKPLKAENEFEQIVSKTDEILWKAYDASIKGTAWPEVRLLFPTYRTDDAKPGLRHRVSEQEARFAMTGELAKSSALFYSVEAPTLERYQFTGKTSLSGQTDVAVYSPERERLWNVEFKSKGFSAARNAKTSIQKDIQKLLREKANGLWFHLLEGIDSGTLSAVWGAFASDLREVAQNLKQDAGKSIPKKTLIFHVCILRQMISVEVCLTIDPNLIDENWLNEVRAPVFPVRVLQNPCTDEHGWKINSLQKHVSNETSQDALPKIENSPVIID